MQPQGKPEDSFWDPGMLILPGSDGRDVGCTASNVSIVMGLAKDAVYGPMIREMTVTICQG